MFFKRLRFQQRWEMAQKAEKDFWNNLTLNEEEELKWKKLFIPPIDFSDKVILDVGCGPRGVVHYIKNAKEKIGIDPLMNFYKEKYTLDPTTKYLKGVCEHLPIDSDSVDVVFCINVLDHVQSPKLCLKEIHRVMKQDGLFVFAINVYPLPICVLKILREKLGFKKDFAHLHTFTLSSIKKILKKFFKFQKIIKIRTLKFKKTYLFFLKK